MKLYIVKFPDTALYATGPQKRANGEIAPGGLMAYALDTDAEIMAHAIDGTCEAQELSDILDFCERKRMGLYIRQVGGGVQYVGEYADPEVAAKGLIKVEGNERERAIAAANILSK